MKIVLVVISYAIVVISIIAYYKINYRMPFANWWLGYKPEVKMKERIIIAFIIQIPTIIYFLTI